ncbi:MAG TPA: hypothetical protein ENK28_04625 [Aliiroseovarius sp.]|nr:hypothetical protein [Aliiroseovarius sp.]
MKLPDPQVAPPILGIIATLFAPNFLGGVVIGISLGLASGALNVIASVRNKSASPRRIITDLIGGGLAGGVVFVVVAHAFDVKLAMVCAGFAGLLVFDLQEALTRPAFLTGLLNRLAGVKPDGKSGGKSEGGTDGK